MNYTVGFVAPDEIASNEGIHVKQTESKAVSSLLSLSDKIILFLDVTIVLKE